MKLRFTHPIFLMALMATSTANANFIENWDDGGGAARWSAPIEAQEDPGIAFDGHVNYAFDYSTLGIASAPNSVGGTTIGVSLQTNLTDQCPGDPACDDSDEGEGVGIVPLSPLGDIPAGDFTFKTDMYFHLSAGGGTTEYATMGVFSQGTAVPLRFGLDSGDGLAWSVDSDGESTVDLFRFENPPGAETGLGEYEDIPNGSIPSVPTGDAGSVGPFNQWVELEIASVAGMISFSMNGFVLDIFDNSGGAFAGGSLMIGQFDPFNSVNPGGVGASNMAIFDNITLVTDTQGSVPEPATLTLLLTAFLWLLGLQARRSRTWFRLSRDRAGHRTPSVVGVA